MHPDSPRHVWFMSLTLAIILMFLSNSSAHICFYINIPKLTSCFPRTENALAMCVCTVASHVTFCFRSYLWRLPFMNFRTYVRQFVISRTMQTEKHMVAMHCAVASSSTKFTCCRMWHTTADSAPTRPTCISISKQTWIKTNWCVAAVTCGIHHVIFYFTWHLFTLSWDTNSHRWVAAISLSWG